MLSNNSQPRSSMIDALGGELQNQIQENAHLLEQIVRLESKNIELEQKIEELEKIIRSYQSQYLPEPIM